jgi:hypothetical protein
MGSPLSVRPDHDSTLDGYRYIYIILSPSVLVPRALTCVCDGEGET